MPPCDTSLADSAHPRGVHDALDQLLQLLATELAKRMLADRHTTQETSRCVSHNGRRRRTGRIAALLDVPLIQAAQNVVPVAITAAESVERLQNWASGRCLSADQPGIYRCEATPKSSRRRVSRDPSNN